jgi:hypothetical protein
MDVLVIKDPLSLGERVFSFEYDRRVQAARQRREAWQVGHATLLSVPCYEAHRAS